MTPRLASAPCTWGVWERTVDRDDLIPPDLMLQTVRELGYTGIELGPPGYFGDEPDAVLATLEPYGLELVGAFAPLRIADEEGVRRGPRLRSTGRSRCSAATGARGPVVLAADENETRLARRGPARGARRDRARGRRAAARGRAGRAGRASAPARRRDRGVPSAHRDVHREPRGGRGVARRHRSGLVKIAFDTGHCVVGGGDPVELARQSRRPHRAPPSEGRRPARARARPLAGADRRGGVGARALLRVRQGAVDFAGRASARSTASAAGRWSSRTASPCRSATSPRCGRSKSGTSAVARQRQTRNGVSHA